MIYQFVPIHTHTSSLAALNTDLIKVRRLQAKLNGRILDAAPIGGGLFWSPLVAGPYLTPAPRWED